MIKFSVVKMALASWFLGSQLLQENHSSAYIKPSHRLNGIHSMQTLAPGVWFSLSYYTRLHTSYLLAPFLVLATTGLLT